MAMFVARLVLWQSTGVCTRTCHVWLRLRSVWGLFPDGEDSPSNTAAACDGHAFLWVCTGSQRKRKQHQGIQMWGASKL
jgi:hypothetical protein